MAVRSTLGDALFCVCRRDRGVDARECGADRAAEAGQGRDNGDADESSDETVFDGRGPRLAFRERGNGLHDVNLQTRTDERC